MPYSVLSPILTHTTVIQTFCQNKYLHENITYGFSPLQIFRVRATHFPRHHGTMIICGWEDAAKSKEAPMQIDLRVPFVVDPITGTSNGVQRPSSTYQPVMGTKVETSQMKQKPTPDLSKESLPPTVSALEKRLRQSEEVPKYEGPARPAHTILAKELLKWDFNIRGYIQDKNRNAFMDISFSALKLYEVDKTLKIDDQTILNWLDLVDRTYKDEVPYHNSLHAGDVVQAVAFFLNKKKIASFLSSTDKASVLIAAIVHDIHHPGFASDALKNLKHRLCLKHVTPYLERHHIQTAFTVTLENDECNIFKNLDPSTLSWFKDEISELILATDMAKHKEYYGRFKAVITDEDTKKVKQWSQVLTPENKMIIKEMILKNADVSAAERPLQNHVFWAEKIAREFHRQTLTELEVHVEPTMPEFTELSIVPKTQLAFMEFIRPMLEDWDDFLGLPELKANFKNSKKFWQQFGDKENFTFEEVHQKASKNEV